MSHFVSPCPALCVPQAVPPVAEPQAMTASGEAAPLPSLESALDAALRERCAAPSFSDLFISPGVASYGAKKGLRGRQALIPACLHTQRPGRVGSHAAAARVAIEYHRSILTGTRLTASMAATAACSLVAAAAAVAALRSQARGSSGADSGAPAPASSGAWRPSSAPQVAGRQAPASVGAWAVRCASLAARASGVQVRWSGAVCMT